MKRWRMKREQRLQAAQEWIPTYTGKDIVRGYRRRFKVNRLCALIELKMCGLPISDEKIEAASKDQERLATQRAEQKELRALDLRPDQNENFACIIGYTSGGTPYGVTWDEWDMFEQDDFMDEQAGCNCRREKHGTDQ